MLLSYLVSGRLYPTVGGQHIRRGVAAQTGSDLILSVAKVASILSIRVSLNPFRQ